MTCAVDRGSTTVTTITPHGNTADVSSTTTANVAGEKVRLDTDMYIMEERKDRVVVD